MDLPNIPTDNLYKFLALSGLLLVVASVVYPQLRQTELSLQANEVNVEMSVLEVEVDSLRKAVDAAEKRQPISAEEAEKFRGRVDEISTKLAKVRGKKGAVDILNADMKFYTGLKRIGIIIGALLSLIGFIFWYFCVQRPTDAKLREI